MSQPTAHFHVGQRVVCIDASLNPRHSVKLLSRGKIYVIRAIDQKPGWQAPGWGVHLEGIWVVHPDLGCQWPMKPSRFRPIVDRPTDIEVFRRLLAAARAAAPAAVITNSTGMISAFCPGGARSMSAMPRKRRLAVKASPVAMGQKETYAVSKEAS